LRLGGLYFRTPMRQRSSLSDGLTALLTRGAADRIVSGVHIVDACPEWHVDTHIEPHVHLQALRSDQPLFVGGYSYSYSSIPTAIESIGRYCSLAHSICFDEFEHPTNWLTTSSIAFAPGSELWRDLDVPAWPLEQKRRTRICNDVWIGARAYVRSGVTIGDGAIIGADAVVTKDVPPYAVVVGNPGRVVRYRFDEATIARLLSFGWWRFDYTDFGELDPRDVAASLTELERREGAGSLKPWTPGPVHLGPLT